MSLSKEEVTLIAACIAASVSIVTLILNLWSQRSAEMRVAYRQSIEAHIADLSEALHQCVATANIYLLKANSEAARKNWIDKCRKAAGKIKSLRIKLRYPLWGLDEGLRTLSRIGDFSTHLTKEPERAQELITEATRLKDRLDSAIRRAYNRGILRIGTRYGS